MSLTLASFSEELTVSSRVEVKQGCSPLGRLHLRCNRKKERGGFVAERRPYGQPFLTSCQSRQKSTLQLSWLHGGDRVSGDVTQVKDSLFFDQRGGSSFNRRSRRCKDSSTGLMCLQLPWLFQESPQSTSIDLTMGPARPSLALIRSSQAIARLLEDCPKDFYQSSIFIPLDAVNLYSLHKAE